MRDKPMLVSCFSRWVNLECYFHFKTVPSNFITKTYQRCDCFCIICSTYSPPPSPLLHSYKTSQYLQVYHVIFRFYFRSNAPRKFLSKVYSCASFSRAVGDSSKSRWWPLTQHCRRGCRTWPQLVNFYFKEAFIICCMKYRSLWGWVATS